MGSVSPLSYISRVFTHDLMGRSPVTQCPLLALTQGNAKATSPHPKGHGGDFAFCLLYVASQSWVAFSTCGSRQLISPAFVEPALVPTILWEDSQVGHMCYCWIQHSSQQRGAGATDIDRARQKKDSFSHFRPASPHPSLCAPGRKVPALRASLLLSQMGRVAFPVL